MKVRCCVVGVCWLLALGVICHGNGHGVNDSSRPISSAPETTFLVKPYLQLGDVTPGRVTEDLLLLWHADDVEAVWAVEYQTGAEAAWRLAPPAVSHRITAPAIAPHRLFRVALKGLVPGKEFAYRVRKGTEIVFTAAAHAPKGADQPYRFVSFGDCGAGTAAQKAVAYHAYLARPDFLMITGDIVYSRGRISEYREKFWPVYNADVASTLMGAPLLRSTLFVAAPGNHDIATRDLENFPDGLAYFLYWDQPRNGPLGVQGGPLFPLLAGPEANRQAFVAAAGETYPRMANFSFDYGNAHWTVLDSNPYVDWNNPELRAWVDRDLAAARDRGWRFVAFHHPGFNSSRAHFNDQQMRLLANIFEAGRVDVVFSGHVHNYQRTYPLRFAPEKEENGKLVRDQNKVPGRWTLDKVFDGRASTRPQGVIYLVTGAGGNTLYNPEQQDNPGSWQPFTHKFISKIHTLTVADVNGTKLTIRQVSMNGEELDQFTITK
jgi:acid phosphatase type 7